MRIGVNVIRLSVVIGYRFCLFRWNGVCGMFCLSWGFMELNGSNGLLKWLCVMCRIVLLMMIFRSLIFV